MAKYWAIGNDINGKRASDKTDNAEVAVKAVHEGRFSTINLYDYDESKNMGQRIGRLAKTILPKPNGEIT